MLNKYTTIEEKINGEIVEKKSKFIANIFPVESEEDALENIANAYNGEKYVVLYGFLRTFTEGKMKVFLLFKDF